MFSLQTLAKTIPEVTVCLNSGKGKGKGVFALQVCLRLYSSHIPLHMCTAAKYTGVYSLHAENTG